MRQTFIERLSAGPPIVLDGATGTNLQARGLERGQLGETWVLEHPEHILQLHQDFIQAGAEVILTCTFNGGGYFLKPEAVDWITKVDHQAVGLARQAATAAGRPVFVAGSMGPLGQLLMPLGTLTETDAFAAYAAHAKALADAGVDLLLIETQYDLNEAAIAIRAVRSVSDKPLVCTFSFDRGTRSMMGARPEQAGKQIATLGIDAVGINCGRSLADNLQALQELRAATALPLWFKPNAGLPRMDATDQPVYDLTPEAMGAAVVDWLASGARLVGGCCGTTPAHLAAIAGAVA
ncbi:MAG: methionine synthase [Anaerolineae bacterium]|jgi:5-methyltetrahydrofolate--homocysteine methyltransferase|nr:methionine synthase [Anaerolineae bacterium]